MEVWVTFWMLLQIVVNLLLFVMMGILWSRLSRPAKEDPRMSKGLQLLQSKISVIEDLSDRTDVQVKQLTSLLEQKIREIQNQIQKADQQMEKIDQSMKKSLEVANIFQDKIPHDEIVERQNTKKYVKAAKLAHQGFSAEEIAQQVDLSKGEIEFVVKVNKDQLMFSEELLPDWVNQEDDPMAVTLKNAEGENISNLADIASKADQAGLLGLAEKDLSHVFELPRQDDESLKKLGDAFKLACEQAKALELQVSHPIKFKADGFVDKVKTDVEDLSVAVAPNKNKLSTTGFNAEGVETILVHPKQKNLDSVIRKVEFPRIHFDKSF